MSGKLLRVVTHQIYIIYQGTYNKIIRLMVVKPSSTESLGEEKREQDLFWEFSKFEH